MGTRTNRGRLLRRRGGCTGRRACPSGDRQRCRRLHPHTGSLLRRVQPQVVARNRPAGRAPHGPAGDATGPRPAGGRPHGALATGPQPCAGGDGRGRHIQFIGVDPQVASAARARSQGTARRALVRRSPVSAGAGRTRRTRSNPRHAQIRGERRGGRHPLHPRRDPRGLRSTPGAGLLRHRAGTGFGISRERPVPPRAS